MIPPRLETERLILRPFQGSDYGPYLAAHQRADVVRHVTADGKPLTDALAWRSLAMFAGHWTLRGFGSWSVEEKASGAWVGRVGLHMPEPWPELELGYLIDAPFWRRGYAVEAGRAAQAWGKDVLELTRLVSYISPENAASIATAKKLGGVWERRIQLMGLETEVFAYRL